MRQQVKVGPGVQLHKPVAALMLSRVRCCKHVEEDKREPALLKTQKLCSLACIG